MTAYAAHHAAPKPGRPSIFRSVLRMILRKPFTLAGHLPARADADRYPCCVHCLTGSPCIPPNLHLAPCSDCDDAEPVLGDAMLSEVREQWNAWHDGTPGHNLLTGAELAALRPTFTPRTATEPAGFPALTPAAAASVLKANANAQGLGATFGVTLTPQEHADAMHWLSARFLPAPPRPVNGRTLPDQPRRQPVYGEVPQLEVECDAAYAAGQRARGRYQPPPRELLQRLLEGVKSL